MTGTIRDLSTDRHGKTLLTLEINERQAAELLYDELNQCEKCEISVTKWKKKRSLDSNAYCWALIGKLSAKTGIAPEVIYREAVKDIGGNYEILPIRHDAVEKFCSCWMKNGLGWITDTFPSKLSGYINVMAYYGSSTYNTGQMHRLLESIIAECKTHGIETRPKEEIEAMMQYWEGRAR